MRFETDQLETLVTIAEEGTFDAAAGRLHVTPSAVSQRIRSLEHAAGTVLLRRGSPATVTPAGEPLLRLGRQLRLVAAEAEVELDRTGVVELPVAVNADSLAGWFTQVLAAYAARPGTALRLHVEDEGYSHDLLRRGEALAAVTADPEPVQGCAVQRLGVLRYFPAATPELLERHRRGRGVDWARIPMITFNELDRLQADSLARRSTPDPQVVHRIPSATSFNAAVRCGLGWGMLPEPEMEAATAAGEVVRLPGARPVDVTLCWQRWRLDSAALSALTDEVVRAARVLRRVRPATR